MLSRFAHSTATRLALSVKPIDLNMSEKVWNSSSEINDS